MADARICRSPYENFSSRKNEIAESHTVTFVPIKRNNTLTHTPDMSRVSIPVPTLSFALALTLFILMARYINKKQQQTAQLFLNWFVED